MKEGGYIKLWRQAEHSTVWQAGDGVWRLWCCLLMRASRKERKAAVNLGRHTVILNLTPGQYVIRERLLCADLGISRNTLSRRLEILRQCECIELQDTDRKLRIATILNWQQYQIDSGSKSEPLSEPLSEPVSEPVSEPHHKKTKKTKKVRRARTPFEKPTVADVREYAAAKGIQIDPERFVDYYESNGWRVGRNAMQDWQASVRNWTRNGHAPTGNGQAVPPKSPPKLKTAKEIKSDREY